jgi:hypothetical protein
MANNIRIIEASPSTNQSRSFVDTVLLPGRARIGQRRFARQLRPLVRHRIETQVHQNLEGAEGMPLPALGAGLAMDLPHDYRQLGVQRLQHLDGLIREEVQNAASRVRDELALRSQRAEDIQSDLGDRRSHRQAIDDVGDNIQPPPSVDSLRERFQVENRVNHVYATLGRLRWQAVRAYSLGLFVLLLEGALVYLSLHPVFSGIPGVAAWLLPAQALLLTVVMLYLAHKVRPSQGRSIRWLPTLTLVLIALSLSVLRVGVMVFRGGEVHAAATDATIESWAIVLVMFLGGICLALIGGEAFRRANEILTRANRIRQDVGESLSSMEANLSATRADEANRMDFLRRTLDSNRRTLPRLGREIERLEGRLRGEHARTRRLVQSEIEHAVDRLSAEIQAAARQLARWHHGRPSHPRGSASTLFLPALTAAVAVTAACGPLATGTAPPASEEVLIDTSASMPSELRIRVQGLALHQLNRWATTAHSGARFSLWHLSQPDSPFPADRTSFTMPQLRVPAHIHRARAADDLRAELEQSLSTLPFDVKATPLLEAIYFIASTRQGAWRLTVYSDLQQESRAWDAASRQLTTGSDEEVVATMLSLCPQVGIPPTTVHLVSWPGLVTKNQSSIREHGRHREIFTRFFGEWAPEADVTVASID